jgi:hypothetical protein
VEKPGSEGRFEPYRELGWMARPAVIQRALLLLCAFAFVQLIATVVHSSIIDGYTGFAGSDTEIAPFIQRIDQIDPASPVAIAGLRAGDRIDLRAMTPNDRMDWMHFLRVGTRYHAPIFRSGHRAFLDIYMDRNIADDPWWQALRGQFYFKFLGICVMLALVAFMVYKRPESTDVALLSSALLLTALGVDFGEFGSWDFRNGAITIAGFVVSPFLLYGGAALLATYAIRFGKPPSRTRRTLTYIAYAIAFSCAAFQSFGYLGFWFGFLDPYVQSGFISTLVWFCQFAPYVVPPLCALLAIRASRGAERSHIAWAMGAIAILYVAPLLGYGAAAIGRVDLSYWLFNTMFPIAAACLTYSLLGHRLLDIGFALNRAAVFAVVSIVVLGSFSLAEWALGGWLNSASKSTNVVVSALLALGLGLAIHPIHALVDRLIDTIFFRKRHEAEQALRTFATEAAFITNPAIVIERAVATLLSHTECAFAEILLNDGEGSYGGIDENDPALVTLRASRALVKLRGVDSALSGEYCFPMSAGGRLVGALVVGPKRFGESFAPDERDAIAQMAHGVGVALALLGATGKPRDDAREVSLAGS